MASSRIFSHLIMKVDEYSLALNHKIFPEEGLRKETETLVIKFHYCVRNNTMNS